MVNDVQEKAIELVCKFEKEIKGRTPKVKKTKGYDILSSGVYIEIKSFKKDQPKSFSFRISKSQYEILKNKRNEAYIYVVYNLGKNLDEKNPKLKIISLSDEPKITPEMVYRLNFNMENWSKLKEIAL